MSASFADPENRFSPVDLSLEDVNDRIISQANGILPDHTPVEYETVRISLIGVCICSLLLHLRLPC